MMTSPRFNHGRFVFHALAMLILSTASTTGTGCGRNQPPPPVSAERIRLTPLRGEGTASVSGIELAGAGNEWVSFVVQVNNLPENAADRAGLAVVISSLNRAGDATAAATPTEVVAYQLIDMPMDSGKADFVRHVGQPSGEMSVPRALLPLPAAEGRFSLAGLRSGRFTNGPTAPVEAGVRLWVDVRVGASAAAGQYEGKLEVVRQTPASKNKPAQWRSVTSTPIAMTVHNFAIPDQRSLKLVGQVSWRALVSHYEGDFEAVTPRLLNRRDEKYAVTVKRLDALMVLAQKHRVSLVYPDLQPSVKWPADINNAPPDVWWDEFDSVVTPWISGSAFADGQGVGYWPLPEYEQLMTLESRSRLAYWGQCASHFDQKDWLDFSSVALRTVSGRRPRNHEPIEMSMEAARLLASHPRISVSVPLEDGQVQVDDLKQPGAGNRVDPIHVDRLRTAAPGTIAWKQDWPAGVKEPRHWLRTDLADVTVTGAGGEERDIRLWAWLAFLRKADQVFFAHALPTLNSPKAVADPAELVWFYPGEWFGLSEPVPTVQLKWLRAAEQDYEYLALARNRGEMLNSLWMARLLTKPVEIGLGQSPDPSYSLMTGTADSRAWTEARRLLVKLIELHPTEGEVEADKAAAMEVEILQWARPQERPLLIGRSTDWSWKRRPDGRLWVNLSLGLDIYNASDIAPGNNQLLWTAVPEGYERRPEPMPVAKLEPFKVVRGGLVANFNPDRVSPLARQPMELELNVDSPTAKFISPLKLSLPVAGTDRREGRFSFDGRLDDWIEADMIQDGPLVKMLSRPAVLAQAMEPAATPSKIYTNWAADNFYVGFAVQGLSKTDPNGGGYKNFVEYQARRAWGEDLCQVLVQPVYADNTLGPILHVVCKPNGSNWVERKLDPRLNAEPWEPYEGTGTRYAAQISGDKWTGELAVPWNVLDSKEHGRPTLLRFNFAQHRSAFGESASWAGPVDFGRDDALTGLLILKYPLPGNPGDAVQGPPGSGTPGVMER